jgi:hypothetical protein
MCLSECARRPASLATPCLATQGGRQHPPCAVHVLLCSSWACYCTAPCTTQGRTVSLLRLSFSLSLHFSLPPFSLSLFPPSLCYCTAPCTARGRMIVCCYARTRTRARRRSQLQLQGHAMRPCIACIACRSRVYGLLHCARRAQYTLIGAPGVTAPGRGRAASPSTAAHGNRGGEGCIPAPGRDASSALVVGENRPCG